MRKYSLLLFLCALLVAGCSSGRPARFVTVPLGTEGGLADGNLTAYLLAVKGTSEYVALDAGTVLSGLKMARDKGSFHDVKVPADADESLEGWVLRDRIKAYLLSHAHLDHVAGLIIGSTDDSPKPIVGLSSTLDFLRDDVFNWKIWPNFGNEGLSPLNQYTYVRLQDGQRYAVPQTEMNVELWPLCHSNCYPSSAFLIEARGYHVLYLGDTGPDEVEQTDRLHSLWTRLAPLVREGKLCGMFIEVSYPDGRSDDQLFGHLTPSWLMKELQRLAVLVDPEHPDRALRGLTVVVTHIKPSLQKGPSPRETIAAQLKQQNTLGVRFVLPEQGLRIEL
ncbi:MAG: 3',5'-cyclic-nucleotide phosphodiesterase [Armatimonadetes bacterium]|nr:3',5'-cyclic-nucleotide phosphodiesterase [Armatimonadota bacterium]